jgi:hypothetical protein
MNIERIVMAGFDPWAFSPRTSSVGIHAFATAWIDPQKVMDHRVKPGDDDKERRSRP